MIVFARSSQMTVAISMFAFKIVLRLLRFARKDDPRLEYLLEVPFRAQPTKVTAQKVEDPPGILAGWVEYAN